MPKNNEWMPPLLKDRLEKSARTYVDANINEPTDSDYLYTMNVMLQGVIEYMEWQRELDEAGRRAMEQPK